ncbi:MAG: nitronate monooxygenase [Robiginitomaculum sp.]|nr:nitronate monooxygenase [Robiginitomaculum sp.]
MPDICDFLSIEKPVLQGAMGGVSRHDLVTAVSNAGGLGTLGYMPPSAFERDIRRIKQTLGAKTFAVNLLMPLISKAHIKACLKHSVPVVTLFYGFDQKIVDALKQAGSVVLFQVGSTDEAKKVISAGADGVIVQGYEAGGHVRGTTELASLLPKIKDAFPDHIVCGAGGIYDKASADACRALGADAVCSGTRFLASPESYAHAAYKAKLLEATETVVTDLFGVGWRDPHRVIPNDAVQKWCQPNGKEPYWLPVVHAVTGLLSHLASSDDGGAKIIAKQSVNRPLYTPASLAPKMPAEMIEVVALYAGECVRDIHTLIPAADTVAELAP